MKNSSKTYYSKIISFDKNRISIKDVKNYKNSFLRYGDIKINNVISFGGYKK